MTKLEERLKQLLSNFEPFNYGNSDDEQRDAFVEGFKAALELPELKALVEGVNGIQKEYVVGSDGTRIKCACGREGCIEFWCSAGDVIYTSSYANKVHPHVAITKWRSLIG